VRDRDLTGDGTRLPSDCGGLRTRIGARCLIKHQSVFGCAGVGPSAFQRSFSYELEAQVEGGRLLFVKAAIHRLREQLTV
jgi:hypothetical protein